MPSKNGTAFFSRLGGSVTAAEMKEAIAGDTWEQLEARLKDYLGVKHISLFTNGTIALVTALQASSMRSISSVREKPY